MDGLANDIIHQLRRSILCFEGYKQSSTENGGIGFRPIDEAFPNHSFPTGTLHDFLFHSSEDAASTTGFISALLSSLMKKEPCLWITSSANIFPYGLTLFNIHPDNIILIEAKRKKDILWITEELLKCKNLSSVVAEIKDIDLATSRRLQLAVEQSGVTGFILRNESKTINPITSVARWRITSLPSELEEGMQGVGFPRWNVELLKVKNGKSCTWQLEWRGGFDLIEEKAHATTIEMRKTG